MNLEINNARIRIDANYYGEGSVLRGDRSSGGDSISVEASLDSAASTEQIAVLLKEAEASCFTIGALRNPVPVAVTAVVNGQPFDPARPAT